MQYLIYINHSITKLSNSTKVSLSSIEHEPLKTLRIHAESLRYPKKLLVYSLTQLGKMLTE